MTTDPEQTEHVEPADEEEPQPAPERREGQTGEIAAAVMAPWPYWPEG